MRTSETEACVPQDRHELRRKVGLSIAALSAVVSLSTNIAAIFHQSAQSEHSSTLQADNHSVDRDPLIAIGTGSLVVGIVAFEIGQSREHRTTVR